MKLLSWKSPATAGEIEKIIMSNENRGRGMKEGWKYVNLGELCSIERGGSPRPIKNYITEDPDGINWIKIGDTDKDGKYIYSTAERIKPNGLKKSRWVDVNDFLLSNSMSFGRPYILKTNGCIHDGWLVLRNYQANLIIDFFYYLLISPRVQEQFRSKAQGSTVSNLNTQRVANVLVSYPPLSEQQSIVAHLDASFAEIDALKAKAAEEVANAKAMFDAALREEMTPKEGWEEKTIQDIVDSNTAISYGIVQPGDDVSDGVPIVRPVDLVTKTISNIAQLKRTTKDISSSYKRTILNGKEILMCVRGTTGVISMSSEKLVNCNVTRGIVPLKIDDDMLRNFTYYFILAPIASSFIQQYTQGAALKQINIADVKRIPVFLPPLADQQRIVAKLDTLRSHLTELEQKYNLIAANCDALKQAILRETFE